MHIGLQVDDLDESVEFYTRLFGMEPTLRRPDYAKWMLDDPRMNFSLDTTARAAPARPTTASKSSRAPNSISFATTSTLLEWPAPTRTASCAATSFSTSPG